VTLPSGEVRFETRDGAAAAATDEDKQGWDERRGPRLPFMVIDTAPDDRLHAVPRVDRLFIGSQDAAASWRNMSRAGVTHVVNAASAGVPCFFRERGDITYLELAWYDTPEHAAEVRTALLDGVAWIHSALQAGGTVLVHCNAGVSRSSTLVLAYLLLYLDSGPHEHDPTMSSLLSYDDALALLRSSRPCVRPNAGFTKLLRELAEDKHTTRSR
jgi:predicted protein tyrosine phosphatase